MGTLGFLLPFREFPWSLSSIRTYDVDVSASDIDDYAKALDSAFAGRATVLHRMRLSCRFHGSDGERLEGQAQGL